MESEKKPLGIRIIYWTTNILFWIYVVTGTVLAIWALVFMLGIFDTAQLHVGVPIYVNILEQGSLDLGDSQIGVQFSEMTGKLHFIDTPVFISRTYSVFMMAVALLFFYIFWTFRQFINTVYRGVYFDTENILSLKKIAYSLVGLWGFVVIYGYFQYFYLALNMHFETIEITGNVQTYPVILLAALFIWVLSHIFAKGSALQDEQNLTI